MRTEEEVKHQLQNTINWISFTDSLEQIGFKKALEWVLGKNPEEIRKEAKEEVKK